MYKALRNDGGNNPNPVLMTTTALLQKSQHVRDYVLCGDCEQLLNRKGESWVVHNAFTGREFRLQERVLRSQAVSPIDDPRLIAYAGAEIDGVDMEKLVYFGASLFWRASVHRWRLLDARIHGPLGRYEEELRRYLLGARLAEDVAIYVYVASHQEPWRSFLTMPLHTEDGSTTGMIFLAGLAYQLRVGSLLPVDLTWSSCHSQRKYIFTSTSMDDANAYVMLHTYLRQSGRDQQWSARLIV